jgi:hypothetical protein
MLISTIDYNVIGGFLFGYFYSGSIEKIIEKNLNFIFNLSINVYLCSPKIRERFGSNTIDNI